MQETGMRVQAKRGWGLHGNLDSSSPVPTFTADLTAAPPGPQRLQVLLLPLYSLRARIIYLAAPALQPQHTRHHGGAPWGPRAPLLAGPRAGDASLSSSPPPGDSLPRLARHPRGERSRSNNRSRRSARPAKASRKEGLVSIPGLSWSSGPLLPASHEAGWREDAPPYLGMRLLAPRS